jgi:hypothetical protein
MKATGLPQDYFVKAIDVDPATISRFWNGERGLRLSAVDKLARLLNLELQPARRTKGERKRR